MDTEKLTDKVIILIESVARIEENTKFLPDLKEEFDQLCAEVQKNTAFRKNVGKFVWTSITAIVTSLVALIVSLVTGK
jgi:hypothetical protein